MYLHRKLEIVLKEVLKQFPACFITGPRQTGKSTLLQNLLKDYNYVTFDDILNRKMVQEDPAMFIDTYKPPVILDEIQYVPDLLSYIKIYIDNHRRDYGQYVLTGSQIFQQMKGVSESLAGRIAILQLYPLSFSEILDIDQYDKMAAIKQMLEGFYPEFQIHKNLKLQLWYGSYISTYLERDLKSMRNIHNLEAFQRYIILLASRAGQLLNLNEISKECGISQTTAKDWLSILKATSIIYLLEPYYKNMTKRIVKSPKLFFVDIGLLCYLLRIETLQQLVHSPFVSHIFENMVIMEKIKHFTQKGERAPLYFYRTRSGLEIDLIIDHGSFVNAYEIKFTASPKSDMTNSLNLFKKDHKVKKAILLNLHKNDLSFSNGCMAKHWSYI